MKISRSEINAVIATCPRIYSSEAIALLEAAYRIRRARKQAKRERQRKEKDKQVVESVKPTHFRDKPIAGMSQFKYDEMVKVQAGLMAPKFGSSKAPEWDGTFRQGHWRLRNDELGTVIEIKFENKYPLIGLCDTSGVNMRWNLNGESFLEKCRDFDLIRPWPKGEQ